MRKMKMRGALRACLLVLTAGACALPAKMNPAGADRAVAAPHPQVTPQENPGGESRGLEELQQENLLQTLASSPAPLQRWSKHSAVLSAPFPDDHPESFILDLKNLPELGHADTGSQNPNIQVTIEVVEDTPTETEVEMDLAKEGQRNNWSAEWININKKLFWPLFWEYPDQVENGLGEASSQEEPEDYSYSPEDSVLSQVGGGWAQYWSKGWDGKDKYEYEDWSGWAPCSATCGFGTQKRSRSCGYACTATESRTCDLESCPNAVTAVTELTPSLTSTSTDSNVDSCEKWLSCKNDFLQRYLHQVRTQLPSCPCSYPSEAVYSAVNIPDEQLQRTYRWRDASGPKERLDIYKPSARFCLRSMLSYDSATLAAQHCCYDDRMRLITRGKGAGSPDLISTEFSPELHYKVDVLPWILCKGDWSRFHSVRPPNNGLDCEENPPEPVFKTELREAREY
ncbi:Isthmin-2 [Oryzias melastigma]|uniref:Isthmin-2 n=1 Tax=Oryzias melastigma TaxID=30732 RepID=A0A834BUH9_ORYME|nr:Isthmin-2 [Oryzias melastigma]